MPPLLLIHGAFSHAGHFGGWARFFAQAGFDCHVASLPGHAPSDPGALAALTMADYLAALQRACAQLTAPPILIGHSMGGLLAQQLAATGPCAALGCVASAPPWMLPAHPRALPFLLPLMPTILRGRTLHPTETILRALALNRLPGHEQAELIPTFVAESGKAYRAMILGAARRPGKPFAAPVLCVSGGSDRIISNRTSAAIARLHGAQHLVIAGRGHWLLAPSLEQEVAGAVLRWLGDHGLAGKT